MNGGAELADAFAVDDAEFENAAFAAHFDVIEDERFDVLRAKGVQVEHAVDGQFDGVERRFITMFV